MALFNRLLPNFLKPLATKVNFHGVSRYCPVCESSLKGFLTFGIHPRADAQCPVCGSLERHRMLWLFFNTETGLFRPPCKRMLHIAPERCFAERLGRNRNIDYLTADLFSPAMVRMDVTDIRFPDGHFDVIYCSHVLEHVEDDKKAMRELARVLAPGGWAVLQVPMGTAKTFEDPSVTNPAERERLFGQRDHVRVYGPDYKDRLEEAGFKVGVVSYCQKLSEETLERYGLRYERGDIYYCKRP